MRFADLFRLALENLRRNRGRSVMTLIGVVIGVAALAALLAYGAGIRHNARSEFNALALYNTLRVTSGPSLFGALGEVSAPSPPEAPRENRPAVPLTDSLLRAFEQIDGVLAAYPEVVFPVRIKANDRRVPAQAEAIPMAFAGLPAYRPVVGAFFTASADSAVLLAPSMARRLGFDDPAQIVGREVVIETMSFHLEALLRAGPALATGLTTLPLTHHHNPMRVAGLLPEEEQAVSGFFRVILPLEGARRLRKITFFSTLDLMLRDGDTQGYVAARVQLTDLDAYERVRTTIEQQGLFVTSFREQFARLDRLFLIMDLALGVIGFIALLVATIGIANTMTMNVMERYREIGVMKAVGGDEGDLQRLFLVESATLGLAGGLGGLLFGGIVTTLVQAAVDYYLHRLGVPAVDLFHLSAAMGLAILAVALLVSLVAGLAPARRAARIEPIDALRTA